jgi:hypothetical protein
MLEMLQGIDASLPEGTLPIASPASVSPLAWVPLLTAAALLVVLAEARRALARSRPRSERRSDQNDLRTAA